MATTEDPLQTQPILSEATSKLDTNPDEKVDYSQYSFLPIHRPKLESFYQRQKSVFWTPQELDFSRDRSDWDKLDEGTREFIKFILFFFAQADGIVNENLFNNFKLETSEYKEAGFFYTMQGAIETIHNETYSMQIQTFIRDVDEQHRGFNGIENYDSLRKISDWIFLWMDRAKPLIERVVAFACVEGIFFSSAFAAIYYIKNKRKMMPGLCKANEFIARDEALHTEFAIALYHEMVNDPNNNHTRLEQSRIHEIIRSAVDVSETFVREALKVELIGMNADTMVQYVKCTADSLSESFGYSKIFNQDNPYIWMAIIGLSNKTNFHESKVSEYARQDQTISEFKLTDDEDF